MENLTAEIKEQLKETIIKVSFKDRNTGRFAIKWDTNLLDYCKDHGYIFECIEGEYLTQTKVTYSFGCNTNTVTFPTGKLIVSLVDTVMYNLIYLGDESKIYIHNAKFIGTKTRVINKR